MANHGLTGGDSASNLVINSFNVNSIGKNPKRQEIFKFLNKKNADINVLVDTRISKDLENCTKQEWGSSAYFSSFTSQSRGVAIFIKKNVCFLLCYLKSPGVVSIRLLVSKSALTICKEKKIFMIP